MIFRKATIFSIAALASLIAAPAFAGSDEKSEIPKAVASATATGEFDFDEARLTFSVNNEGPDAAELAGKLAKKGTGLVEALKALGLNDGDLRVSGPSIAVRYAIVRNANGSETVDRQRIDGFTGYIAVTARFKDFTKLGKAMSDGVKLGTAVSGPDFDLATSDEKLARLAVQASKEALVNAKAMIEATGRKAGRVMAIQAEGGVQPMIDQPLRAMAMAAPTPDIQIPVNPGRRALSKTVTVAVEIIEP